MKQRILAVLAMLMIATMVPGPALAGPSLTLQGSAPAWANSKNFAGAADPNGPVGFRVYLGWNDADAAEALARAVSDPKSSRYRQYLTPAQFRRQFAQLVPRPDRPVGQRYLYPRTSARRQAARQRDWTAALPAGS